MQNTCDTRGAAQSHIKLTVTVSGFQTALMGNFPPQHEKKPPVLWSGCTVSMRCYKLGDVTKIKPPVLC